MEHIERAPLVWIVNAAGHDMADAGRFGELRNITEGRVNVLNTDRLAEELKEKLKGFDHRHDFLLLSGAILLNAIVLRMLWKLNPTPVNMLVFNFTAGGRYVVRTF